MTVCIPARWGSVRLPGKLARPYRGRPVIRHAVQTALDSDLGPVVVLADDDRLLDLVRDLPVQAVLHTPPVRNGSERIASALAAGLLGTPEVLVNVQGDAVGVTTGAIQAAVAALHGSPNASLGTVAVLGDPAVARTHVVVQHGHAVSFSRRPLTTVGGPLHHIGVYAYAPAALLRVASLAPGPRELAESLEQLRWMEHGESVAVAVIDAPPSVADAIDVAADLT